MTNSSTTWIVLGILASFIPAWTFRRIFLREFCSAEQALRYFYLGAIVKYGVFIILTLSFLQLPGLSVTHFFISIAITELALRGLIYR